MFGGDSIWIMVLIRDTTRTWRSQMQSSHSLAFWLTAYVNPTFKRLLKLEQCTQHFTNYRSLFLLLVPIHYNHNYQLEDNLNRRMQSPSRLDMRALVARSAAGEHASISKIKKCPPPGPLPRPSSTTLCTDFPGATLVY